MKELRKEDVKDFVLAGNALVTLQSGKTGKHFTYKIKRAKEDSSLYFIRLLAGPDNSNDYRYIGCYYEDSQYLHLAMPWRGYSSSMCPPGIRAIDYLFDKIDNLPDNLHIFHEGRCGRCGRILTTPESIERGLGPECAKLGG